MRVFILLCLSVAFFAQANESAENTLTLERERVNVIWQDYPSYNDVKPVNQGRKKFSQRVFNELSDYIDELAESLPAGQRLEVTVTNLDLAGQVFPASFVGLGSAGQDVRLVKNVHIPRLAMTWTLLDEQGVVLKQSEEKLKDMSFNQRHNPFFSHEFLRYEKNMLRSWFKRSITDVAKN